MHSHSTNEVIRLLDTSAKTGLTGKQVNTLTHTYGSNELPGAKPKSIITKFFLQFNDFMIYTLLAAAILSFFVSYINGETDWIEPAIILIIVIVNAIIGVAQETKAEHSLNALKKMSSPTATVLRDKKWQKLPSRNLVPGDIIMLETGNLIPADARVLTSHNLMCDESSLTGESEPVSLHSDTLPADTPVNDRTNMLYSGCLVCYGHGTAIVTDIGINTQIGKIAHLLINEDSPETPLQKRLAKTGKILSIVALIICVTICIIGITKNRPIIEMFMTAVSLAVAAIPEGLPAIVTIMLSLGVTRMAANKAIIRKLPAVETLGSTTVICSDKTGTLTQNKMNVVKLHGYENEINMYSEEGSRLLSLGILCNNSVIQNNDVIGEPTENALVTAAIRSGINTSHIRNSCQRINELPFDSKRKLMTTMHRHNGKIFTITKGAPDVLTPLCTHYIDRSFEVKSLSKSDRDNLLFINNRLASDGLRVLAIAYRNDISEGNIKVAEEQLVFVGYAAMIDPPRKEAALAVRECKFAGIKPIMITGDHLATATKIATDLGIIRHSGEAITGKELDELSDTEFAANIHRYGVFARVSPEHKLRLVRALQKKGEIVAMTGDGVNDAPALKAADIGCSMGITGTDVAKNASDMILEDDNFSTITLAIKEGRSIYDNIKKSIHFLISCNIGEILTIFMAIVYGLASPLYPVQLLWINLITDSLPAIALGMEPADMNIMRRPPISPKKGIFSDGLGARIAIEGMLIGSLALVAYSLGLNTNPTHANTMCFAVLGLAQLFHSFNTRSESSLFHIGIFSNIQLVLSSILCAFLQIVVICVPVLNTIFSTTMLYSNEWIIVFVLSFLPIPIMEIQKLICNKIH